MNQSKKQAINLGGFVLCLLFLNDTKLGKSYTIYKLLGSKFKTSADV